MPMAVCGALRRAVHHIGSAEALSSSCCKAELVQHPSCRRQYTCSAGPARHMPQELIHLRNSICRGRVCSTSSSSATGVDTGTINKTPVATLMTERVYQYLLQHTREPQILRELREETAALHGAHLQISPEQGQFMAVLVELMGVRRAVEVGVFTGYSSLAVALALPDDGRLVALDKDAKSMAIAQKYWEAAAVSHKVEAQLGPGLERLQQLLDREGPGSFDFAFIDADKRAYLQYYELCLQLVRQGGLIAVDNVLFYGKVADPQVTDKATVALRAFNEAVIRDERVTLSIVPVGDGMALCRKR